MPGSFYYLIQACSEKYNIDIVIIDMNPGLGAINQTLFMSSDGFILPTNPDPFSVMAINTLAKVTPRWNKVAADFNENFKSAAYKLPDSRHVFLGSLIQRFNLMKGKPANAYTDLIKQIKIAICQTLVPALKKNKMLLDDYPEHLVESLYTLAEIRNFDALMTFSNEYAVPVFDLKDDQIAQSGAALNSMTEKRDKIKATFGLLSDYLMEELAEL